MPPCLSLSGAVLIAMWALLHLVYGPLRVAAEEAWRRRRGGVSRLRGARDIHRCSLGGGAATASAAYCLAAALRRCGFISAASFLFLSFIITSLVAAAASGVARCSRRETAAAGEASICASLFINSEADLPPGPSAMLAKAAQHGNNMAAWRLARQRAIGSLDAGSAVTMPCSAGRVALINLVSRNGRRMAKT